MAAFGDEKMEGFTDRPWNSLPENLYDYVLQKATDATTEEPATQQESSSMKLKKEDMMLYGLCPAQDEFFLAICERCKLLVKPQALKKHIAIRHSNTEINDSKAMKTNDHTIRQNSHSLPEQFKNPRDYLGAKSQTVTSSRCHNSKHGGRRSNALVKHSSGSDGSFSKNSKAPATTKNCASKNDSKLSIDASRPTLMERITEGSERMSSILRSKPYVDIARIDSEIMSLISAMDESNSENVKASDSIEGNDGQPPKLEPETKSDILSRSEPQKISLNLLDQKALPRHHVVLANTLAKTFKSSAPFILSGSNGKLSTTSSSSNDNSQHSDSSSEVKGLPQPLIQLNLQSLRPLLSKTVIGHPSILAIKKAQLPAVNHLQPNLKPASPSRPSPLLSSSSILVHKATSLSPSITLTSPKPHVALARNKPSPSSAGKSSKKKGGNPDHALCKNRQYDPDKHCGVLIPETQKPCTRFLTCKTHPLLLRRSVHGRSKPFDELVREQREKRQALVRGDSEGMEHKLPPGTSILKAAGTTRANSMGSKVTNPMKSLFADNKKGPTLVATCPNVIPQKPNHLPLPASVVAAPGNADSLLKLLPDQSPSEDVFSGLLSPSGMLLSPCGAGMSLFSPESSGNAETFLKLKTEALEEMDFGFQTPDGSMPSLMPFEMKEEDMVWQDESKFGIGETFGQTDTKRLIKQEEFGVGYEEGTYENGSDEYMEDREEFQDDDFFSTKNGLNVANHHPRPIAANHFNSWLQGDGNYVFTRRGETCRSALMTAVQPEAQVPEPPRKRPRLDSTAFKPQSNISLTSINPSTSDDLSSHNRHHHDAQQKSISSKYTNLKTLPTDLVHSVPPQAAAEAPSQTRKRLESRSSFQCPLLPPNVTLTRSSVIPTPKSSSTLMISPPAKKQISLTPINISQIAASLKGAGVCGQVSLAATSSTATAVTSAKGTPGSQLVHLTLPTSVVAGGLARTLFAISASPGTTASSAATANKTLAQSIAISKGATLLLQQPTASQHSVLSPTVILAPSKGANQSGLFAIQNSPETLLQLLPRGAVQNGRVAKKQASLILSNKGKTGTVDLSSVVGLGLRPPNIFLSTSGAGASSSSASVSFPSVVGLNLPTSIVSKNSGQIQNLVLRLPNGIVDSNKTVISHQDSIIRVSSTSSSSFSSSSSSSSVMVVTSLPDRPINSVLLINNKRLALSSTAASAVHPSHQSINLSSVLANQRQASSQSSSSSNSGLLLWGINSSNGTGSTNVVTLQQQQQNQQPQQQRLQRVQLVSNQQAVIAGKSPSNHVKESSAPRLNGIGPRNAHILLGIPHKRQSPFQAKGQLVLGDLDDLGDLQAEEEIPTQSTFSSPHRVILKGGSTSNLL